jgi:hypothetical protein
MEVMLSFLTTPSSVVQQPNACRRSPAQQHCALLTRRLAIRHHCGGYQLVAPGKSNPLRCHRVRPDMVVEFIIRQ